MQVIRALVAADPGNLADISSVMRIAANSDNQALRLSMLRIGLRFNHAMFLRLRASKGVPTKDVPTVDSLLVDETDAPDIPHFERNQPLPASRVESSDEDVFVVHSDENRLAAGRPAPAVMVEPTPDPAPESVTNAQGTPQSILENTPTPVAKPAVEPTLPKPAAPTPATTAEPIREDSNLSPGAVAVDVKPEDEESPF